MPAINLIGNVPAIVAVSSTVDNRSILPDHLVDGKLDTAWNSRTNQLAGAWVGVRLPADVHVDSIKLTAGFTKKDKRYGDLFTMNPRIKKVRVLRDGKLAAELTLDPELRTLQDIPINAAGGEYRIEITDIIPGTKKTWREISISELQVWGAPGKDAAAKQKPIVRVGSFDPPPALTRAQCVKAMFPEAKGDRIGPDDTDHKILGFEGVALGGDIDVCRIDHGEAADKAITTDIAAVKRNPRLVVIARLDALQSGALPGMPEEASMFSNTGSVRLSAFPLTTTENGLLVESGEGATGPMTDDGHTDTRLYRVSATGMTPVLTIASKWAFGEAGDGDRCTLLPAAVGTAMPALEVECVHDHMGYPPDPSWTKTKTLTYRWSGNAYARK